MKTYKDQPIEELESELDFALMSHEDITDPEKIESLVNEIKRQQKLNSLQSELDFALMSHEDITNPERIEMISKEIEEIL